MSSRKYGEDLWCIQKHLLLAGVHTQETLQKLYREDPSHRSIDVLEKRYDDLTGLRHSIYGKWGNLGKQEQFNCGRCLEDLDVDGKRFRERKPQKVIENDEIEIEDNTVMSSNYSVEKSLNTSVTNGLYSEERGNSILIQNKIVGGDKMARRKAELGVREILVIDAGILLGVGGSVLAEWAGKAWCKNKAGYPVVDCNPADPSYVNNIFKTQNLIEVGGGFGLQILAWFLSMQKGMKLPSFILALAGGQMVAAGLVRIAREQIDPMSDFSRAPTSAQNRAMQANAMRRNTYGRAMPNQVQARPMVSAGVSAGAMRF